MPLDLSVAGVAFKHRLDTIFNNVDFCTSVADNIIESEELAGMSEIVTQFTFPVKVSSHIKKDML